MSALITVMKCMAIGALLTGMLWPVEPNLRTYLNFIITAGTLFALIQAANLRKYAWVAVFGAIACVFNPLRPIEFSFGTLMALQIMNAVMFAVSLQMLKTSARLTTASITGVNPETEAL